MNTFLKVLFIIIIISNVSGQEIINCGSDYYHKNLLKDSIYYNSWSQAENTIYTISKSLSYNFKDTIFDIPVVFHLICRPGSTPGDFYDGNPDDNTVVNSFLYNLNLAYENAGAYNQGVGVDMNIRFCLAQQDTNGNYTTGITRFETALADSCGMSTNSQYTDSIKKTTFWNPEKYLNIWIVASLVDASGFSTFPWLPRSYKDGVIIDINYLSTDYMAGVMLAHEIGHYLGLYHVFQGGCPNNDCLLQGDRVCDTPPSIQDNIVLSCTDNTCFTDADDTTANNPYTSDVYDNLRTYMNYGLPACINQFTDGQKTRALICLQTYRDQLINSDACQNSTKTNFIIQKSEISIYPNPVTSNEFKITNRTNNIKKVSLVNIHGNLIYISDGINNRVTKIILAEKPPKGIYTLIIKDDKGSHTYKKIIII
ncbi:MAG: hypothetical protein Kow0068_26290 [Marinilabiliales bacterium]